MRAGGSLLGFRVRCRGLRIPAGYFGVLELAAPGSEHWFWDALQKLIGLLWALQDFFGV